MKPVLETPRMVLRGLSPADLEDLFAIFSDPVAMRHYPSTRTREQTRGWIEWNCQMVEERGHAMWAAELRDSRHFVGTVGLVIQHVADEERIELGYLLLPRFWGRGLATEAARACRDHAFEALGASHLIALIDPANGPSRRVAERVGLRFEREIERWERRVCVYGMAPSDR